MESKISGWTAFDTHPEFNKYDPTQRTKIVKTCCTTLIEKVVLGDVGYVVDNVVVDDVDVSDGVGDVDATLTIVV